MREIAERAHHAHRLLGRERAQLFVERLGRAAVVLAAEFDGILADRFDNVENRIALLLAHDIAEQAAEVADVLEERLVLVFAAAAAGFVLGGCTGVRRRRKRCNGSGSRRGGRGGRSSSAAGRARRSGRRHDGFPR